MKLLTSKQTLKVGAFEVTLADYLKCLKNDHLLATVFVSAA
jgi:hypothetical protein